MPESYLKITADLMAAPQDVSLPIFRSLKAKGYRSTRWHTDAGAKDTPCLARNNTVQDLNSFLFGLQHAAPIYEKTHVGCKCTVEVTAKGKPSVMVNAFGIIQGQPDSPAETAEDVDQGLPPEEAEAVAEDVAVAEGTTKTAPKSASEWRKKAAPKKDDKNKGAASKAVPVNKAQEKAGSEKVTQLVKKVLDV